MDAHTLGLDRLPDSTSQRCVRRCNQEYGSPALWRRLAGSGLTGGWFWGLLSGLGIARLRLSHCGCLSVTRANGWRIDYHCDNVIDY